MGPCGVLIITTPSEIFWEKIVSFYSALVIRFEIYPKLPLFMGKFSFFRIFYGKKLYGKLFSVPVNCSLRLPATTLHRYIIP